MANWKFVTDETPTINGAYICTIEATEGEKTWRFTAGCYFDKETLYFTLPDNTGYGSDCIMDGQEDNFEGSWCPFSFNDTHRHHIHCRVIAWIPNPEPCVDDGYTGETGEAYSYECS